MSTNQLIISIDSEADLAWFAKIVDSIINVKHMKFSLFVKNYCCFFRADLFVFKISLDCLPCWIVRVIINENRTEIAIILWKDRINVVIVPKPFKIQISWNNDAEWLFFILADVILCFIVLKFSLINSLYRIITCLPCVCNELYCSQQLRIRYLGSLFRFTH